MATRAGTLDLLARELALALAPLEQRLAGSGAALLFEELGLRLPAPLMARRELVDALAASVAAATPLGPAATSLAQAIAQNDGAQIALRAAELLTDVQDLLASLRALSAQLSAGAAQGLTAEEAQAIQSFAITFVSRLVGHLAVEYLESRFPRVTSGLVLAGLVERELDSGTPGDALRTARVHKALRLDRLPLLLETPEAYLQQVYGWGTPQFDAGRLLVNLGRFLNDTDVPAVLIEAPNTAPVLEAFLFEVRPHESSTPPGLDVALRFPGTADVELSFPLRPAIEIAIAARGRFAADVGATITPPARVALSPPSGEIELGVTAGVVAERDDPFLLLGLAGGSRLEAAFMKAAVGFLAEWESTSARATGEPTLDAEVRGGRLLLDLSGGDSFLTALLPPTRLEMELELAARWRPSSGLRFEGSASAELAIPVRARIGPVDVHTIHVRLGSDGPAGLLGELSTSLDAELGPFALAIERVGVEAAIGFPQDGGNLGPLDVHIRFHPPSGMGVVLDAGVVVGGGFLDFDEASGRYAGIVRLEANGIGVTTIALVETRLPPGGPPFSFLLIVATEFAPIQLGYGFTLTGVGGVAGVHRSAAVDALRCGLGDGDLDALLFPADPVGNAQQIITALDTLLPVTAGRHVFAPTVRIGWGVPALLTAELGVLLELPDPIRLIIVGQITVAAPPGPSPILLLHLDVLGTIDFGRKQLAIDAALYDSWIALFTLSGDMALRLTWSDPPNFALAIGGFNPRFQPPPGFPALRRVVLALGSGNNPRLTCHTYLALTSNSVQIGAAIEVFVAAGAFNVYGWLTFDALAIVVPFSFVADFSGGVELRRGQTLVAGIHLDAHLSGPSPWHAWGEASISLLFFDVTVGFDVTFGTERSAALPEAEPWPLLQRALEDRRNWSATLQTGALSAVTFANASGDTEKLLVDPGSALTVHQRVLPLNRTLTKFGEARPVGPNRFTITAVTVGGRAAPFSALRDFFAPGQFEALSDAEKVSRGSFELMDAGVSIGARAMAHGTFRRATSTFESIVFDQPKDQPRAPLAKFVARGSTLETMPNAAFAAAAERRAFAAVERTARGLAAYALSPAARPRASLADEHWVIASTSDLKPRIDLGRPTTRGAAAAALAAHLAARPADRGRLQVVRTTDAEQG